jgi:hypothetical protein
MAYGDAMFLSPRKCNAGPDEINQPSHQQNPNTNNEGPFDTEVAMPDRGVIAAKYTHK